MKDYVRNSAKVLFNYVLSLIVFAIFAYIFMSLAGSSFNSLLPFYCFVVFLFVFFLVYSDMKKLAEKEKKPQYELNPYPLKGLVYGALGFLPIAVLELISVFIVFEDKMVDHLKHVAVNVLMGPLYFIIRILGEKPLGYILASLVIPLLAMLGYMAGYFGVSPFKFLKKTDAKPVGKGFQKSPWNPTNRPSGTAAKKKKKKKI